MLKSLSIHNYAIIENLEIDFYKGFSTVTGETGAGKSIILGALSLIIGNRADASSIKNQNEKCIVEGIFDVVNYNLQSFFQHNELDYNQFTIIRREINTKGISRAFINDTPVSLQILKEISTKLIDIHSQHENMLLNDLNFQLNVVDIYANSKELLTQYKTEFKSLKEAQKNYNLLQQKANESQTRLEFLQFQFDQIEEAKLNADEQELLEEESQILSHAVDIKLNLNNAYNAIYEDEKNVILQLKSATNFIDSINKIYPNSTEISERMKNVYVEIKDIVDDIERLNHKIEANPNRLEEINLRLDLIYNLQKKFQCSSIAEIIDYKNKLETELLEISSYSFDLEKLKKEIEIISKQVENSAQKLSENRKKHIAEIEKEIEKYCSLLGMPNISFQIKIEKLENLNETGKDKVQFLFSANKNIEVQEITKIASGGELSRLMLSIKYLMCTKTSLPTIIFDEIDTGISGNIADKMGNIMQEMAKNMQVISITHLPQIAAKGNYHYVVFKDNSQEKTQTGIRQLSENERTQEIAKMLSGKDISEAAISNAMELLKK